MENDPFTDIKTVIADPLKFKAKLAIGEDAYTSMRLVNSVGKFWDTYGWAATGAGVAKSAVVASTFFAPTGFLAAIGLGGAAVTPIGWVIAAAVVSSGTAYGIGRFWNETSASRVTVIPKFINTPIDLLAVSIFDLVAPLALKVAAIDGNITDDEREWIKKYFSNEWGFDDGFLDSGLQLIETRLEEFTIKEVADSLAEYSKGNPDCNYPQMAHNLVEFLKGLMEVDGKIDEREELAIEKIEATFIEAGRTFTQANFLRAGSAVVDSFKAGTEAVVSRTGALASSAKNGADVALETGKTLAEEFLNRYGSKRK